jgi:hypothetical protein
MKRSRVRVEIADHPEAPERLEAALAAVGGRVVSVDIHELDGRTAIDELVTELPDGTGRDELAVAVERHAGATLLSSRADDRGFDAVSQTLHLACAVVEGDDDMLSRAISVTCGCSKSWVSEGESARAVPTGRLALDRRRPVVEGAGRPALPSSDDLPHRVWLLAVPDRRGDRVAFVARPLSLRFSADEVARVEALVRLRDRTAS